MAVTVPHVPNEEARRLLEESERLQAKTKANKARANWVSRRMQEIITENHLSEKIRHALGD